MTMTVRPATRDDIMLVWTCRQELNDPMMRQSGQQEVLADHQAWMARAVQDPDRLFLIVCTDDRPIGYVRFDPLPGTDGWRVSLCLLADARGGGRGRAALALGCAAADTAGKSPQIADIHADNIASARVFEACGFQPMDDTPGPNGFRRHSRGPQ